MSTCTEESFGERKLKHQRARENELKISERFRKRRASNEEISGEKTQNLFGSNGTVSDEKSEVNNIDHPFYKSLKWRMKGRMPVLEKRRLDLLKKRYQNQKNNNSASKIINKKNQKLEISISKDYPKIKNFSEEFVKKDKSILSKVEKNDMVNSQISEANIVQKKDSFDKNLSAGRGFHSLNYLGPKANTLDSGNSMEETIDYQSQSEPTQDKNDHFTAKNQPLKISKNSQIYSQTSNQNSRLHQTNKSIENSKKVAEDFDSHQQSKISRLPETSQIHSIISDGNSRIISGTNNLTLDEPQRSPNQYPFKPTLEDGRNKKKQSVLSNWSYKAKTCLGNSR